MAYLAFSISVLGKYQANLGISHCKSTKKVLRYMQRTKNHMLVFRRTNKFELVGYIDAYFEGCADTSKSTSSFMFMMGEGAVAWKSVKQSTMATSNMYAECVACYYCTQNVTSPRKRAQNEVQPISLEKLTGPHQST